MFIKKDLRKIDEILKDNSNSLQFSKRSAEFQSNISILCSESVLSLLNNVEAINLYDNSLTTLTGIGILANTPLKELNIGCNKLSSLPLEFARLQKLETLWLDDNHIEVFPVCLCQLPSLVTLRLSSNLLTSVPSTISSLTSLQLLALDNNMLSEFPDGCLQLLSLRELWLRQNRIATIPEEVSALTSLRTLSVSSNRLTSLPDGLSAMNTLSKLYINGNKISKVTASLCQLVSLEVLNLANNCITGIPTEWSSAWGDYNTVTGLMTGATKDSEGGTTTPSTFIQKKLPVITLLGNPIES